MPTIAIVDGVSIMMHHIADEHPPPHVHADYAGRQAKFGIKDGELMTGDFPPGNRRRNIRKWILENQEKLLLLWETNDFDNIKFD